MKVKDLLDLVKEDGFLVEIDNTETDFQCVLDVAEAIWSYGVSYQRNPKWCCRWRRGKNYCLIGGI